jgi:hypothetical protein
MASTRQERIVVLCLLALLAWPSHNALAENDALLATISKPAIIVAARAVSPDANAATSFRRPSVIIGVSNYHPADDGTPVEVVVKARIGNGVEREVGRFGVTPDRDFVAAEPSDALRFSLPLPRDLTTSEPVTFSVQLASSYPASPDKPSASAGDGRGKGAYLRVGEVEIR